MPEAETALMIRDLRTSLGMTQEGLARELGVTISTVYRWEKGRNQPSGLALRALDKLRTRSTR